MNLSRGVSYGRKIFDKFYNPLSAFSAATVMKPGAAYSKFFSSVIDSCWSMQSNKLTLKSFTPLLFNFRGMKVRGNLQLRCKNCYFERKDGILYVNCTSYPRHKQKALTKKLKYTWILTFASQSKFRPY